MKNTPKRQFNIRLPEKTYQKLEVLCERSSKPSKCPTCGKDWDLAHSFPGKATTKVAAELLEKMIDKLVGDE